MFLYIYSEHTICSKFIAVHSSLFTILLLSNQQVGNKIHCESACIIISLIDYSTHVIVLSNIWRVVFIALDCWKIFRVCQIANIQIQVWM